MSDNPLELDLNRITLEMRGPHLIVTLDHPDTRNALTDELMHELNVVLDHTRDDLSVKVGDLYAKLNQYPKAVVAVVEGAAFGGGFGMVCCADIVIVGDKALFALSETSLGLAPAQIAPYIVTRLGEAGARRLAVSGIRWSGRRTPRRQ